MSEVSGEGATLDRNLTAYIGEEPGDSSVLQIFGRVIEALHTIHMAAASHTPLSPQSIRLSGSGQPHIQPLKRPHETVDTVAFGSIKYAAPEAFVAGRGNSSCEIGDCYVLGFIFYEILIGRRLFVAQFASLENGPPSSWLKWHADKTARARPLSEIRPNLGHFGRLIDGMMEKDPSRRINSISQVLTEFSNVEAQTAYNIVSSGKPATPKRLNVNALLREKLGFAAVRFAQWLAGLRKPRGAAAVGMLIAAIFVISALLIDREAPLRHDRKPTAAAQPRVKKPSSKAALQPPLLIPPAGHQVAEIQPPLAPEAGSELQIESHVKSGAFLLLDDLPRIPLSPDQSFTEKVKPGHHTLKFLTRSKSLLKVRLNIEPDGDISFFEHPKIKSLNYAVLASNGKSARLYAPPNARAGLPGQPDEPVPDDGRVLANDKVLIVRLREEPKREVRLRFDPLPAQSIKIVLEPGERGVLVPVEISANVSDAGVVINGEKLKHQLENGVRVVRLRPGEYRVKLVHADYEDSAEQDLVVSGNEQRRQLKFSLPPIVRQSTLAVTSLPAGVEILVDGTRFGLTDSSAVYKAKIDPGMHTVTLRRPNFEDFTTTRDFPNSATVNIGGQGMRPFGKITFHVLPANAQITCRRKDATQSQDCINNQPCLLQAGTYDITAKASGYKPESNLIVFGAGDDRLYDWKLEAAPSALKPADFFENGQNWTVDSSGWWSQDQRGYSFMRASRGTFVFDILKPSGVFANKKVFLVVNYRGEGNRVLYTIDQHNLRRNERAPGFEAADYSVAHENAAEAAYRLTLELLADRVIIRNAAGKTLDNLPLVNPAQGKVGFEGKVKLRIIQSEYPRYSEQ